MNERTAIITCPTCGKMGDWFAGRHGPFCSHRCKLIDLGKWFRGEHVIAGPPPTGHFEEVSALGRGAGADKPEET
ncbi:MAG: DNA gyrase inhibitor YacG [Verrucomicrobia bacterium]|nr:DNA gyrase inhibitor YacG [Verrucomicrobiota bacterium]MDE3098236.1 DNA gyrase inhibitor YacG [Verrucomicrobiota bacterium]